MENSHLSIVQVCSAREAIYGAVQSLMILANAQRTAGDRVEFLTFAGKKFGAQVRNEKFTVHEVKFRSKVDPIAILRMRKIFKSEGYDIVHTHLSTSSVNGTLAAKLARIPSVATVHGMSGKGSFLAADRLIAVSQGVRRHLVSQGVGGDKISVVYNGVPVSPCPLDHAEARGRLGLPLDIPVLGTVSRVTGMKGIADAIRAVARLTLRFPDLRYIVVGDGDELESCRALASELGIFPNVTFAGYQQDVNSYLAAMDLFIFPSLKEAMGIALVEAMACGLPIVATDVGGIPEVVSPEVGLLVGVNQPDALALAAETILSNPSLRLELGESARKRAARVFSVDTMRSETENVYMELLGRKARGGSRSSSTSPAGPVRGPG